MDQNRSLGHLDEQGSFHQISIAKVVSYGKVAGTLDLQLPYLKDKENLIHNAVQLMLYGGKEHGLLLRPEIGDQVLVYLYGIGRKQAVVLGVLPPKDTSIFSKLNQENTYRCLQTKGEAALIIQDEKDQQKLMLQTPHLQLALDEQNGICLQDDKKENQLQLKKKDGEVHVKAKEKIVLECGKSKLILKKDGTCIIEAGSIECKGNKIQLNAQNQLSFSSQKIAADAKLQTQISGKSNLKLSSSGILELQGSLIKIG